MATNKELISKGIKFLSGAVPLLFIGPAIIHNAFINKQNIWHYFVLVIGITASIAAIYLLFIGLNTIMKALFND
jgi:hypothetical protein